MEHSGDEKDPVEVLDPSPLSRPVDGTRIESELTGNARQDRITKGGGEYGSTHPNWAGYGAR